MTDRWGAVERTIVTAFAVAAGAFVVSLPASAFAVATHVGGVFLVAVVLGGVAAVAGRHRRPSLLVGAAAVGIGGLWGLMAYDSVEQSTGGLVVRIDDPAKLTGSSADQVHRVGQGPVVLDLRGLRMPTPSPGAAPPRLRVRARADTDNVIVALPESACLRVVLRHRRLMPRPEIFDRFVALAGLSTNADVEPEELNYRDSGGGLSESQEMAEQYARDRRGAVNVMAYGRPIDGDGTLVRAAADPQAPTLELDVEAGGQVGVRNYPEDRELRKVVYPSLQAALGWPGRHLERPMAPSNAAWQLKRDGTATLETVDGRRLEREHRQKVRDWAVREARRSAGPCPTRADLAARLISVGLGTPLVDGLNTDHEVYVDGLGRVHAVERGSRTMKVVG